MTRSLAAALLMMGLVPGAARAHDLQVPSFTRTDPSLTTLFAFRTRTSKTFMNHLPSQRFEQEGTLPVIVRFASPPQPSELKALAGSGDVQWTLDTKPLRSGAYAAIANERGVARLERDANVLRISCDLPLAAPRPLMTSAQVTRVGEARRAFRARDGQILDGHGVRIADLDSGLFMHHPAFFRADGGAYAWTDVDKDGKLTPGTDGVDLNGDGTIAPTEVLHLLSFDARDRFTNRSILPPERELRPALDYLYVDENSNGVRDYGPSFGEDAPAFGEPLFLADDANKDGRVVASEKLLRLKTSKVAAVLADKEFIRGESGAKALSKYLLSGDRLTTASHGTGVAGILLGGEIDVSQFLGLAPGAELLEGDLAGNGNPQGITYSMEWALRKKANVLLTEYAPYTGVPLDGSSEEELMIDAAFDSGVLTSSPAGNLAGGKKHQTVSLHSGVNSIPLTTDSRFLGVRMVQVSILHRAPTRKLSLNFTLPGGISVAVPETSGRTDLSTGYSVVTESSVTPRQTASRHFYVFKDNGSSVLPGGDHALDIALDPGPDLEVDIYVSDDVNNWSNGFVVRNESPMRTLCHPSTADKTITVGAFVLHTEKLYYPSGAAGAIAEYSSRGPRIDGVPGMDIVAPDNPLSTAIPFQKSDSAPMEPFGGTSGAGPHVAAAIALLRQLHPDDTAGKLKMRLLDRAQKTPAGEEVVWGKGKLDLASSAELTLPSGEPGQVHLSLPDKVEVNRDFAATVDAIDDKPGMRIRWDFDYDLTPDTEWQPISGSATQTVPGGPLGVRYVRVEILDSQGNVAAATARTEFVPKVEQSSAGESGCDCRVGHSANRTGTFAAAFLAAAHFLRRYMRSRRAV